MTPDKARDLVASFEGRRLTADYETYGLADGYQHIEHYVLLEIDEEHPETGEPDVWTDTLEMPDKATADMISAAPTLAALAAGMRTEYAIAYLDRDGNIDMLDEGYKTLAAAQRRRDQLLAKVRPYTRIMRRHVGEWEEA